LEGSRERFISPKVQIRPKTFRNVYERSKKEYVRGRLSIKKHYVVVRANQVSVLYSKTLNLDKKFYNNKILKKDKSINGLK